MNKTSFLFLLTLIAFAAINYFYGNTTILGIFGFLLICLSLILGPVSMIFNIHLIEPRRAVGIAAFVFVLFHFIGRIELITTVPITIPTVAILVILTLTSSDYAIKILGPVLWKNIQRLTYLVFIFSAIHFLNFSNYNPVELFVSGVVILTIILQVIGFFVRRAKHASHQNAQQPQG